ncbi:stage II sporulation protein M [Sphingomonas sp. ac-8]|uniref:stage II sporulation protein M n=1 Tax=Sphingomonas sp. ac-8 TaxID=3242977 RepID=UPI003A80CE11
MSAPLFASRHFRAEREADWARLETLLDLVETKSPKRLSEDDLIELPRLYRATLSALSVARDTSLDASLVAYLESLSTRAYFVLYGCRAPWGRQIAGFFRQGLPQAVRALWPEILLATVLTILSAIAAYALVRAQPAWFGAMIPIELASGRDMNATTEFLRSSLYDAPDKAGLELFATFLFTHNAQVSFLCFALGFALGIPTLILLVQNGTMLGAMFAVYAPHGLAPGLFGWLMIHGSTELSAIVLAAAAGLRVGRAIAFPGERGRIAAVGAAGRTAATAMLGVVLMLLVAGLLEGFARQLVTRDSARYAIAGTMFALWLGYFTLAGRTRRG